MDDPKKPSLIDGGVFHDETGYLSFVNDFDLANIQRFYVINQGLSDEPKAWQGHPVEEKFFYCISGSCNIFCVAIDDWGNPSQNLQPMKFELCAKKPQILCIPNGYANAILAREDETKIISFSKVALQDSVEEKIKYDKNIWVNWEKHKQG